MMSLVNKACDRCRSRKIRCKVADDFAYEPCEACQAHNLPCHFSCRKHPRRRNPDKLVPVAASPATSTPASQLPATARPPYPGPERGAEHPQLYIDYLLERSTSREICRPSGNSDQLNTLLGPSPNISFFPAKKVHAISQQLGHNRLERLLESIRAVIALKLKSVDLPIGSNLDHEDSTSDPKRTPDLARGSAVQECIQTYMERVHPFYPFLCRDDFEKRASAPNLAQGLATDKPWACLYYAVLAVGSQNHDGGSYEARTGASWAYFERSKSLLRDIIFLRGSLTSIQALMCLAIFCQPISGFGLEAFMIAEAAVMAQNLGINRSTVAMDPLSTRVFWVLYYMEKTSCFVTGKVPTLQDSHITRPLPDMDVGVFSDYDWFFSFVRYSRLISKIQNQLLTIASVPKPVAVCHSMVESLQSELESWRESIPPRFRPGEPLRPRLLTEDRAISIALRAHYYYHYAYLTLTWTLLHCNDDGTGPAQQLGLKTELMQTARSVLELTSYIEISPSTPLWILALVPLCALMILFDLVIDHPNHSETSLNLALLDIASGHFSRIEYSSNGALPGGLISEFAHLARQYVSDIRHNIGRQHPGPSSLSRTQAPQPQLSFYQSAGKGPQEPSMSPPREEANVCSESASYPAAAALAPLQQPAAAEPGISTSLSDMTPVTISQDQLFSPSVDGNMQHLQFIGVDLMGLFDPTYPFIGFDQPMHYPSGPV